MIQKPNQGKLRRGKSCISTEQKMTSTGYFYKRKTPTPRVFTPTRRNSEPVNKARGYGLSTEEEKEYGNRFPQGYTKMRLLGKGGCGVVWQGKDRHGTEYAIK